MYALVRSSPMEAEHPVEQLTRPPHKRKTAPVFFCARCFADEHDAAIGRAVGENGVGRMALQARSHRKR